MTSSEFERNTGDGEEPASSPSAESEAPPAAEQPTRPFLAIEDMPEEIAEQIIAAKMDTKDDYLNDIRAGDDKPDFKTHLLGGPKFDDFAVERNKDVGRSECI